MSEVKRYAFQLTAISSICGGRIELVEYTGEGMPYVQAYDYDQLKADSEVVADLVESRLAENLRLKAENERMSDKITLIVDESNQHRKERDALRKQLEEARELLDRTVTQVGRTISDNLRAHIDAWLEANKA